jgi:secreted PhoX family phosphatase
MFVNHEYTTEPLMFRGYDAANPTDDQIRIGLAAHGLSLVVVDRDAASGRMTAVVDPRNRRWTGTTPFTLDGPAAGSPLLRTAADPTGRTVLGTFNNCSGSVTPWGTFLSGEENVNQYFAHAQAVTDPVTADRLKRYGVTGAASERGWERLEPRFDVSREPNEVNRFGWVVEVDPFDPDTPAVKHTALGRFKHEGATVRLAADGRAVTYMGDDERFDYVYKFVSDATMTPGESRAARKANRGLLSAGTLYVARFAGGGPATDGSSSGTGEWIRLAAGSTSFVDGMTADEVYVFTRMAADLVDATKMDRPEDVQASPRTGKVYLALTNNTDRGKEVRLVDPAGLRRPGRPGHLLRRVRQDAGQPDHLTGQSRLRHTRQPVDLHRLGRRAGHQRRALRRGPGRADARAHHAVRERPGRSRVLRADGDRRVRPGRGAAPRRRRRREPGRTRVDLAGRAGHPAAARGGEHLARRRGPDRRLGDQPQTSVSGSPPAPPRSNDTCTWSKWFAVMPPRSSMRSQPSP